MQPQQQPDDTITAAHTASNKRSLRVIDQLDLATNREDDLEEGPLLLRIGNSFTAQPSDYPHNLMDSFDPRQTPGIASHAGVMTDLELAQQLDSRNSQYAETSALSNSSYGRSFSIPIDTTSPVRHETPSIHQRYFVSLGDHLLSEMGDLPVPQSDSHPSADTDIVALAWPNVGPSSRNDPSTLSPWRTEFSWVDGQLVYGSDPVTTRSIRTLSRAGSTSTDEIAGRRTHVYGAASDIGHFSQDYIDYSQTIGAGFFLLTEGIMTDAMEISLHRGVIDEMWYDFQERVIIIVDDHFWRTHASQRPSKEAGPAGSSNDYRQSANFPKQSRVTKASGSRRKQHHNGQRDRSEDEHSEDGNQRRPESYKPRLHQHERRVACPFLKNDPDRESHHDYHCPRCLQTFTVEAKALHTCVSGYQNKVLFLTREAMDKIRIKATKEGQGQYESRISRQWIQLYKIIFPDAAPPFPDPFVQPHVNSNNMELQRYLLAHAPTLWSFVYPILPELPFAHRKEIEIRFIDALQTWLSHTGHHFEQQYGHDCRILDIPSSCNVCLAQHVDEISGRPIIGLRQSLQSTSARPMVPYQLPDPRSHGFHNLDFGQLGSNHGGTDPSNNVSIDMFAAAGGCFDDIPQMHTNFAEHDFDGETEMTGDIGPFHNRITAEHNPQLSMSNELFSNELGGPWYAGASQVPDRDAAQVFDLPVDAGYDSNQMDAGFIEFC
ncbi:hypothetical protein E8E14_013500 [Neopestalotiopsis sp. 37M]|nr:hypothetical protein E8E14_013500 [Neopestalotiopsis sp. 37M]